MGNSRFETEDWSKPATNRFQKCIGIHVDTDPDGVLGFELYLGWDGLCSFFMTQDKNEALVIKDEITQTIIQKYIDDIDRSKYRYDNGVTTIIRKENFDFRFVE